MKTISKLFFILLFSNSVFGQKVNYISINDTTLYCWKKEAIDTTLLLQFRKGKILDKSKVIDFFKIKETETNDTLLWNKITDKSLINRIKPDVYFQSVYDTNPKSNPNKEFLWIIRQLKSNSIGYIASKKVNEESNLFKIDQVVSYIYGNNTKLNANNYESILHILAEYKAPTPFVNFGTKSRKKARNTFRKSFNENNYSFRLIPFNKKYIFVHKLNPTKSLSLANFDSEPKIIPTKTSVPTSIPISKRNWTEILYGLLSGFLLFFTISLILYFLLKNRIKLFFVKQSLLTNLNSIITNIWQQKDDEDDAKKSYKQISTQFNKDFEEYKNIEEKLNISNGITAKDAFAFFCEKELFKALNNSENIKNLLQELKISEIKKEVSELKKELNKYKEIIKSISNISELNLNSVNQDDYEKHIIEKVNSFADSILNLQKTKDKLTQRIKELEKEIIEKNGVIIENEKYKIFHNDMKTLFGIVRAFDIKIERYGASGYYSNDNKNNILYYIMLLRNLLNILYCKISDKKEIHNVKYQFESIKINLNNSDEIKEHHKSDITELIRRIELIDVNKDLLFPIEIIDKNEGAHLSLYQQVHTLFNQDKNKFPRPFYFGIEKDKSFEKNN